MRKGILSISLILPLTLMAQTAFFTTVRIEFEKTVYVKQLVKDMQPEWYDRIKDRLPETALTYFNFVGDTSQSLYRPGREVPHDPRNMYQSVSENNIVYNNYQTGHTVSQKTVFEEIFLLEDSLAKISWKLTGDVRNIAGFECRKAIGMLEDSITLFAFYTDEILINGGPESAHGLPGMILGLGMPRIHTTWFATKVEINGVDMMKVKPETKGRKTTRKDMGRSLDNLLKNWGPNARNFKWQFII